MTKPKHATTRWSFVFHWHQQSSGCAMSGRDFLEPGPLRAMGGVRIDELNGFSGHGASPLVVLPGQSAGVAQVARTVADPRCAHFGRK